MGWCSWRAARSARSRTLSRRGPLPSSADQVGLLAGLPLTVTLDVADLGAVLFCHATPRDDEEVVLADSRLDRWADVLGSLGPGVQSRRTMFDTRAACARVAAESTYPDAAEWADF